MKASRPPVHRPILAAGTAIGVACACVLFAAPASAAPATVTFSNGVLSVLGDAASNVFVVEAPRPAWSPSTAPRS